MKKTIAIAAALALCGCAISGLERKTTIQHPDGTTTTEILKGTAYRGWWDSTGVKLMVRDTNGLAVEYAAEKTGPNVQSIDATFNGAIGLTKAIGALVQSTNRPPGTNVVAATDGGFFPGR